jgi:ketosteroid isomerase-like protein
MDAHNSKGSAKSPEDLARLFVERANKQDVEGLVALYEPDAVLYIGNGNTAQGSEAIREFFQKFIQITPTFPPGKQMRALVNESLALTSSRLASGDVTAEVARKQKDGSWLWVIDHPSLAKLPPK